MRPSMLKILVGLALISLAVLSCSLTGLAEKAVQSVQATAAAGVQPAVESTAEAAAGPTNAAGDTISIDSLNQGLSNLKSYRVVYSFKILTTDEQNQPLEGNIDGINEKINASGDLHSQINFSGEAVQLAKGRKLEVYQVGEAFYLFAPSTQDIAPCIAVSSKDNPIRALGLVAGMDPDSLVGKLTEIKLVQKGEQIGKILTDHYSVTEKNFSTRLFSKATGDLWIAQEGRYVVQYQGTGTSQSVFFLKGRDGEVTWDYRLEAVNTLEAIEAPAECLKPGQAGSLPQPPNTKVVSTVGSVQILASTDSPQVVADFYTKALPEAGWKLVSQNALGDTHILEILKDDQSISILVTGDKKTGGTSIVITTTVKTK